MANKTPQEVELSRQTDESRCDHSSSNRRSFLSKGVTAVMAGGLASGYGMFFAMAGRYFYPSGSNRVWIFVSDTASIAPGDSIPFHSPAGVAVMITRNADESVSGESDSDESDSNGAPTVESFLALSSVCPHLGCRVHWESNNNRFFCPCHNGVFDASGKATGGPPAAAGQDLPHYALQVVDGALYIEMQISSIGKT